MPCGLRDRPAVHGIITACCDWLPGKLRREKYAVNWHEHLRLKIRSHFFAKCRASTLRSCRASTLRSKPSCPIVHVTLKLSAACITIVLRLYAGYSHMQPASSRVFGDLWDHQFTQLNWKMADIMAMCVFKHKLNTMQYAYSRLNWSCAVRNDSNAVAIITAADDVVTVDDDTGEASMMRMMGFSDFSSTKASLHNVF